MKNNSEIALLMRKYVDSKNIIHYFPIKVLEGYYDSDNLEFLDFDGEGFPHIIECDDYGFCGRLKFNELKNKYPLLNTYLIKKLILHQAKKYKYSYIDEEFNQDEIPVILFGKDETFMKKYMDEDIFKYYVNFIKDYFEIYGNSLNKEDAISDDKKLSNIIDICKIT